MRVGTIVVGIIFAQHPLLQKADSLREKGDYQTAFILYDLLRAILADSTNLLAQTYLGGAECLANLQNHSDGHAWISAGESLALRLEDTITWAKFLYYRAWLWSDEGNYQRAESLYTLVLEWQARLLGKKHPDYALTLNDAGLLAQTMGRYSLAESLLVKASAIQREVIGERHPYHLITLHNLALVFTHQGHLTKAESLLHWIAHTEAQDLGETHPTYLTTLQNLAALYDLRGQYAEAEALLRRIAPLQAQILGEKNLNYLHTVNSLASNYINQGRYSEAEALLRRVCDGLATLFGKQHPIYLSRLNNLAAVYERQGRYEEAERLYQEVAQTQLETVGKEHPAYLTTLHNLAFVLDAQNKDREADSIYRQVANLQARVLGESHPDYLTTLHNYAILLEKQTRLSEAESLYRQVAKLRLQALGESHPDYLATVGMLAYVLMRQGRYEVAESLYWKVLSLQSKVMPKHHPLYIFTLHGIAILLEKVGKYRECDSLWAEIFDRMFRYIRQEFISLPFSVQQNFLEKKILPRYAAFQAYVAKRRTSSPSLVQLGYRIARSVKGLILISSEGLRYLAEASPDTLVRKLLREWQALMARHAVAAMEERRQDTDSLWNLITSTERDLMQLLPEIRTLLPDPFSEPIPPLRENEAIIEVVRAAEGDTIRYNFYIVSSDSIRLHTRIFSPEQEMQAKTAFEILRSPHTPLNDIAYRLLWSFIDGFIPKNTKYLYFSPDGIYYRINIGALYDGKGFIGDRYEVRYIASSRCLILKKPQIRTHDAVVIGGPAFYHAPRLVAQAGVRSQRLLGTAIAPLPGAEQEAQEIGQLLGIRPVVGDSATEEFVKSIKSPQILHIATHGYFYEGKGSAMLRSGLLLAGAGVWDSLSPPLGVDDGYLTAREASSLNLLSTEVVVLSACETGLGDITGEGLYGLQRAFLEAGAKRVIATLWQIDDMATKELMKLFYQEWLNIIKTKQNIRKKYFLHRFYRKKRDESSVDTAFKRAVDRFRRIHPEPYYWGAFVLMR